MYVFIKKETVSDVNIGYLFFHLAIYVLYLVGLVYYWYTFMITTSTTPREYLVSQSVRTGFSCLSLIGMAFMLYKLCSSL